MRQASSVSLFTPFILLVFLLAFLLAFLLLAAVPVNAQSGSTITSEGVSGDIDKKRRNPSVSVTTVNGEEAVKLLVDAYTPSRDFSKYPLQFDFYVNRALFSSQIRSTELPGPVGVDIGPDIAERPFNYSIVVTVLHPNRRFTSVVHGAVFAADLAGTLDCTVERGSLSDGESFTFLAEDVPFEQTGNNVLTTSFTGKTLDESDEANISATITLSGSDANASLQIVQDGSTTTSTTTGSVTTGSDGLEAVVLSSGDGLTSLDCL